MPIDTSYEVHELVIGFANGNVNLCSVQVKQSHSNRKPSQPPNPKPTSRPVSKPKPTPQPHHYRQPTHYGRQGPPVTYSAFEYDYAFDTTPDNMHGNCKDYDRDDGVDGKYINDEVCIDRDDSYCAIGWTEPHGK